MDEQDQGVIIDNGDFTPGHPNTSIAEGVEDDAAQKLFQKNIIAGLETNLVLGMPIPNHLKKSLLGQKTTEADLI